jgi:hypothetical protein
MRLRVLNVRFGEAAALSGLDGIHFAAGPVQAVFEDEK